MNSMKIDSFWLNTYQRWLMVFGISLLAVALVISLLPSTVQAEEGYLAPINEAKTPCKGLKPYNNIEELLYQFYINLDSGCVFRIPIVELEKIWNTKILVLRMHNDNDKKNKEDAHIEWIMQLNNEYFRGKPYKGADLDIFYIEAQIDADTQIIEQFNLLMTTGARTEAGRSLLPTDRYPLGLPEPIKSLAHRSPSPLGVSSPSPDLGKYYEIARFYYFWLNTAKTRMILLMGGGGEISRIEVRNYISCFFTKTNDLVRQGGAPCKPY